MTQPKDMEQLKKEISKKIQPRGWKNNPVVSVIDAHDAIEQSHLSGRESMRDECVEGAESFDYVVKTSDRKPSIIIIGIVSALKKIKP